VVISEPCRLRYTRLRFSLCTFKTKLRQSVDILDNRAWPRVTKDSQSKTGTSEGTEQLLSQLGAITPVMNSTVFLQPPCTGHAEVYIFREYILVPSFLYTTVSYL
jgi:hypothetical protein